MRSVTTGFAGGSYGSPAASCTCTSSVLEPVRRGSITARTRRSPAVATPTPVVPDSAVTGAGRGDWLTRNPVTPRRTTSSTASTRTVRVTAAAAASRSPKPAARLDAGRVRQRFQPPSGRDQQRDRDLGEQQPAVAGLDQAGPRADDAPGEEGAGGGDRQQQPAGERREAGERGGREDLASGERPQRHHQPDETAEPRRTRQQVEDVGRDEQGPGAKARVCPTRDGPTSASHGAAGQQPAARPVRRSGRATTTPRRPARPAPAGRSAARCRPGRGRTPTRRP